MGKFSIEVFRYLESQHFRVLLSVEMGMKNHEFVPLQLIASIATLHRGATTRALTDLIKSNLVVYERGKRYDGYRLTNLGYDFLALRALSSREVVGFVGNQIGVGKESDVYVGGDPEMNDVVLKFHRLGRTSFRKLKEKRDYHNKRHYCSWLYLSRIAALKEFSFLKALHAHDFPVPEPVDVNRHTVVMGLINGVPLYQVQGVEDPERLYNKCMELVVRLASYGLIHGDFNQFNIMLSEGEEPILIDFPQMVSIEHPNAAFYFERDVNCIRDFFRRKYHFEASDYPRLADVEREHDLDVELEASGFTKQMALSLNKAYDVGDFGAHLREPSMSDAPDEREEQEESVDDDEGEEEAASDNDELLKEEMQGLDINSNSDARECEAGHNQESAVAHSKNAFTADEIKMRLKRRNQAKKEKLRVKGKQNALKRTRRENSELIKDCSGWDKY